MRRAQLRIPMLLYSCSSLTTKSYSEKKKKSHTTESPGRKKSMTQPKHWQKDSTKPIIRITSPYMIGSQLSDLLMNTRIYHSMLLLSISEAKGMVSCSSASQPFHRSCRCNQSLNPTPMPIQWPFHRNDLKLSHAPM